MYDLIILMGGDCLDSQNDSLFYTLDRLRQLDFFSVTKLSRNEALVLKAVQICIKDKKDGAKVFEVANYMGVVSPIVSRTLNQLEKNGYVLRTISRTDRRNVCITLTESGKQVLEETNMQIHSIVESVLGRMGNVAVEQLQKNLQKWYDASVEELKLFKQNNQKG